MRDVPAKWRNEKTTAVSSAIDRQSREEKPLLHTSMGDTTPIAFDISYLSCCRELICLVSKEKSLPGALELCFLNQSF